MQKEKLLRIIGVRRKNRKHTPITKDTSKMHKIFHNIPVMPIQQVLASPFGRSEHQLGPVWPEWDSQHEIRFKRNNNLKDDEPIISDGQHLCYETRTVFWCGAIVDHFGHQIADFSTRIMAYRKLGLRGVYAFSAPNNEKYTIENTPSFFRAITDWLEISEQILLVNKPLLVKELIVLGQQEQLPNVGANGDYLSEFDNLVQSKKLNINKNRKIYVSRSAQSKGVIAGEKYIEKILIQHGFEVFMPEQYSLSEQLHKYLNSTTLVFSEGSALHTMQLLGRGLGKVHVIRRRPTYNMCKNFIEPRAESVDYYTIGDLVCGLRDGKPLLECGVTIPDRVKLNNIIKKIVGCEPDIDDTALQECVRQDLKRYFTTETLSTRNNIDGYSDSLMQAIKKAGYPEVIENE